jgi:hypothetical protein
MRIVDLAWLLTTKIALIITAPVKAHAGASQRAQQYFDVTLRAIRSLTHA